MDKQPLVVIALPVYRGDDYIDECLNSIHNQTYKNWICIINDNRSDDKTVEIAKRYVEKDNRFKLFINDSVLNQTQNWNMAFKRIEGDPKYFKLVCHDDWLFDEYLSELVNIMEANDDVGMCSSYRIDGNDVRCGGLDIYEGNKFNGKDILVKQLKNHLDITGSVHTLLYRTEVIKKLSYYPEIFNPNVYHIDTILAFDVLSISNLGFCFKVLSYTRRHNETYTSKITLRYKSKYYLQQYTLRKYLDLFPDLSDYYKKNRREYAYFIFLRWIKREKDTIEWHKKYNPEPFKIWELLSAILLQNILMRQLTKFLSLVRN